MSLETQHVHELVILTLSRCKFENDSGNEIDLAREVYRKYITIQTTMITEILKPES